MGIFDRLFGGKPAPTGDPVRAAQRALGAIVCQTVCMAGEECAREFRSKAPVLKALSPSFEGLITQVLLVSALPPDEEIASWCARYFTVASGLPGPGVIGEVTTALHDFTLREAARGPASGQVTPKDFFCIYVRATLQNRVDSWAPGFSSWDIERAWVPNEYLLRAYIGHVSGVLQKSMSLKRDELSRRQAEIDRVMARTGERALALTDDRAYEALQQIGESKARGARQ